MTPPPATSRGLRRRALALAGAAAVLAVGCGSAELQPTAAPAGSAEPEMATARGTAEFFAPDAIWNAPLADDEPLDPRSDALVRRLRDHVAQDRTTVNIREWSTPLYRVSATQPTVRVTLDKQNAPELQQAVNAVPLPAGARPAPGTDANVVVYQPATDTIWEFWRFRREADGFHAGWAGRMQQVSQSPGWFRDRENPFERRFWGVTATHIAKPVGLMTLRELQRGRVDHALAIAIPKARRGVWSWPASGTDGDSDDPASIPEGARFRLDPALDIDALDLPPMTRMMAVAAQRYGLVVNNTAGAVAFYAEDPNRFPGDPYAPILAGDQPVEVARAFPFEHLQTLRLQLRSG
ncbi:MAG: hypothetical protein JHC95_17625 [Solirubrobacteraceae bacterium]|nr:hypothetical protein [Solirubrobacteraceae bacterium]